MTKEQLIAFEDRIADHFHQGRIPYPVHYSGGNEDELISLFANVKKDDWIFTTWRSHYHALLKGMPEKELESRILAGESMHIMSKKHNIISSSIVGGVCPIAVGVAQAIKRRGGEEGVWCFVGDGATDQGVFWESVRYSIHHNLPILFVVEDNGLSVDTPSCERMGDTEQFLFGQKRIYTYKYKRKYQHCQTGKFIKEYM